MLTDKRSANLRSWAGLAFAAPESLIRLF
ncbi:hypothetical protein LINPERHAP2_LOCUS26045 [Linum perenne]